MERKNIKVVFMGTPLFAKKSLEALYEAGFNIVAVITNPDKPSGRGMKYVYSEVKEYALSKGLTVYQPLKIRNNKEIFDIISSLNPDFIAVTAYGKILPIEILNLPKYGSINVHGSLLPNYRGSAPIQWAIINGESKTGITTMFMDAGMDTGDMLLKEEVDIKSSDTYETMYEKLSIIGGSLLVETLDGIVCGNIERVKQPTDCTYAPLITKEMTKIDFNKNVEDIVNFIHGIGEGLGTYIEDENQNRYKIYDATKHQNDIEGEIGSIVLLDKKHLGIKCNNGVLEIIKIQAPNSKKMDIVSFLAGNKILTLGHKFK